MLVLETLNCVPVGSPSAFWFVLSSMPVIFARPPFSWGFQTRMFVPRAPPTHTSPFPLVSHSSLLHLLNPATSPGMEERERQECGSQFQPKTQNKKGRTRNAPPFGSRSRLSYWLVAVHWPPILRPHWLPFHLHSLLLSGLSECSHAVLSVCMCMCVSSLWSLPTAPSWILPGLQQQHWRIIIP